MRIAVKRDPETKLSLVEMVDDDGDVVDVYEEVSDAEIGKSMQLLRENNYTALNYVLELLPQLEIYYTAVMQYDNGSPELRWYYYSREGYNKDNNGEVQSIKIESNCEDEAETLVYAFDFAKDVRDYTPFRNDVDAFVEYAEAWGYKEREEGIQTILQMWHDGWNTYEKLQQIFTKDEIKQIFNAIREGRLGV